MVYCELVILPFLCLLGIMLYSVATNGNVGVLLFPCLIQNALSRNTKPLKWFLMGDNFVVTYLLLMIGVNLDRLYIGTI